MRAPSARTRKLARLSAGPIAVLLASGIVWQGSTAAFTATTSNEGNSWTLGEEANVELTNDSAGTAMFNVKNVLPGQTGEKCISLTATSNLPGEVRFYVRNVSTGTATEDLSLQVDQGTGATSADCTGFTRAPGTFAYAGPLDVLGFTNRDYRSGVAPWAISGTSPETVTYRVSWDLDADITTDEFAAMQGQSVNADLVWELRTAAPDAPAS